MRGLSRWAAALSAAFFYSSSVLAQAPEQPAGSIALDSLQPAPPGDPFNGVQGPFIGGHLVLRGGVAVDYADQPLAVPFKEGRGVIVGQQAFMHFGASIALEDRLLLSVLMPVAVAQGGDNPVAGVYRLQSPGGPAAGDLRLGAKVRIFGEDLDALQAAFAVYSHAPTGQSASYVSDASVRLQPQLLFGGRRGSFVWSFALGGDIRGNQNPSAATAGLGAGWMLIGDALQVQMEATSSTLLQQGTFRVAELMDVARPAGSTNIELLFGARWRFMDNLVLGAGAGPGLTSDPGTPAFRLLASLAWSPLGTADAHPERRPGADPDTDHVFGVDDRCPYSAGVKSALPERNGCPIPDKDGDGIDDRDDACPEKRGVASTDPKKDGCPADDDEDGVANDLDLCRDVAGVAEMNGCEADADRDGIADSVDACKNEQGRKTEEPATNGCPEPVLTP